MIALYEDSDDDDDYSGLCMNDFNNEDVIPHPSHPLPI